MLKKKFTEEEDLKLCQLVEQNGARNWNIIAQSIPGRTGRQCRDRYQNYLCPGFFNGQWTKEEDELLHEKFLLMPYKWSKMMKYFPKRTASSIRNRWNYFVRKSNNEQKRFIESNCNMNYGIWRNQNYNNYFISNYYIPENFYYPIQNGVFNENLIMSNINSRQEVIEKAPFKNSCTQTSESSFEIEKCKDN